jgi:hypothetical protein
VARCADVFDALTVGMTICGLHSIGDSPEVRALMGALTPKVQQGSVLDATAVSNVLFGLLGLSDSPELRELLNSLLPKVANCNEGLRNKAAFETLSTHFATIPSQEVQGFLGMLSGKQWLD